MSNPRKKYAVDREAEKRGAPVQIDDMIFVVRSASDSNRSYRYARSIAAGRRREELKAAGDSSAALEMWESIMIEAYADTVILGWENVENGDGHALEFNRENCIKLMEECPELWATIRDAALDSARFKPAAVEEDGGQLGKS